MAQAHGPSLKTESHESGAPSDETDAISALAATLFPALEALPHVPQQARSREKRDEILRAAAAMFVARGYAATTSDEIAAAAGVSVGTFYNYFRNKRQVLVTLVLERLEGIFTNLQLARMDFTSGNHYESVRRAVSAVLSGTETGLRRVWLELMTHDPELVPYQQAIRRHVLEQLEHNLGQAAAHGDTWPDLDVEATALAIFSLLDTLSLRRDESIDEERLIATLTNMVYRAVFPPQPAG
jgi:TetR/AcrR family transcriptional regulator, mexJK operon transcriptional repressor